MKLVLAPDAYKGSLSAAQLCRLFAQAARRHFPQAEIDSIPVADGGEGTVDALVTATGGEIHTVSVTGPLGRPTDARYGILGDGRTAVLEMAQASGLPLVPPGARDPMRASSRGLGELLRHVLAQGFRDILLGLGGSATNDGGMGMLSALGARFTDARGGLLSGSGRELALAARLALDALYPPLLEATVTILCDVTNPLLGPQGATAVYGPQKGATPDMLPMLEEGMRHYARLLSDTTGRDVAAFPGAGAAGGTGAALCGVLGAQMRPGAEAVLQAVDFDRRLEGASLVLTGEGKLDAQSIGDGKLVGAVCRHAARQDIPVVAVVGGLGEGAQALYAAARAIAMTTAPGPISLDAAIAQASQLCADAADRLFRMLAIGQSL